MRHLFSTNSKTLGTLCTWNSYRLDIHSTSTFYSINKSKIKHYIARTAVYHVRHPHISQPNLFIAVWSQCFPMAEGGGRFAYQRIYFRFAVIMSPFREYPPLTDANCFIYFFILYAAVAASYTSIRAMTLGRGQKWQNVAPQIGAVHK